MNTSIPWDKFSVQYSTVDDAISHINEVGVNDHLAKKQNKVGISNRTYPSRRPPPSGNEVEWHIIMTPPCPCDVQCHVPSLRLFLQRSNG